MKAKLSKISKGVLLGLGLVMSSQASAEGNLDVETSTANLTIGLYATLTGLDNFQMTKVNGSPTYTGGDLFSLVTNGAVRVTATTVALSGTTVVPSLTIDSSTNIVDTASNVVTSSNYQLDATANLSGVNELAAGNYSSLITLTVSAI